MADDAKQKARVEIRKAQADFERVDDQREQARTARRQSFEHAQAAGLSLREIAKETGLHFSRVAEVLRGR